MTNGTSQQRSQHIKYKKQTTTKIFRVDTLLDEYLKKKKEKKKKKKEKNRGETTSERSRSVFSTINSYERGLNGSANTIVFYHRQAKPLLQLATVAS